MESAEEFIRKYLREKSDMAKLSFKTHTPFYEKYFTDDWNEYRSDSNAQRQAEEFVSIEVGDQTAHAITIESFKGWENRSRYILCVIEGQWKISRKESKCIKCRGSGKYGSSECSVCDGTGWMDHLRNSFNTAQKPRFRPPS
jgi:hypothetical protein